MKLRLHAIISAMLAIALSNGICNASKETNGLEKFVITGGWEPRGVPAIVAHPEDLSRLELLLYRGKHREIKDVISSAEALNLKPYPINAEGYSLIDLAIMSGSIETLEWVIEHGLHPNTKNNNGTFPVHIASQLGHLEMVEFLIKTGAYVDAVEDIGRHSPLTLSLFFENTDIASLLIRFGANIHYRRKHGLTALHEAAAANEVKISKELLAYGADIHAFDAYDRTPLHNAVSRQYYEMSELLLENGAKVDIPESGNALTIHWYAEIIAEHFDDGRFLELIDSHP